MGEILCRNVKELVEKASKDTKGGKTVSQEQYKDFYTEASRALGENPDFSQMTEKQYKEWLNKGYEAIKDEAVKNKKEVYLQATDPKTGETYRWTFQPAGINPKNDAVKDGDDKGNTIQDGKVTLWSKIKDKLPTLQDIAGFTKDAAVKTADVAARETQSLSKSAMQKMEHMSDVGAGNFGR